MPDADDAEIDQEGERKGASHLDILRHQKGAAAVEAVREDSTNEREQHDWELLHESIEAEKKCGAGQRENEPALGDVLHPGANGGSTRTEPKNAKIAVGEGRQHPAHGASPGGSSRGVYGFRYS